MLLLTFDLFIAPGRKPLPAHLGGVLHGYVEGAVKHHAPHLLPVLRPNGDNRAAHFAILPPPVSPSLDCELRFGVMLFGAASDMWPQFAQALLAQQDRQINRREARIRAAWLQQPGGASHAIVAQGQWLGSEPELAPGYIWPGLAMAGLDHGAVPCVFQLTFRSPLLLASRKAQRERLFACGTLPWPTLGSVLDSIAQRLRELEPGLAGSLGISPAWKASAASHDCAALTPAADAARQEMWPYASTPRSAGDNATASAHRKLLIPGIIGTLAYPASGEEHEHALLYWGQWLGVGQKTTMGWGSYALSIR